jgi:hypothetical protein
LIDGDHAPEEHLGTANDSFYSEGTAPTTREHLAPDGVLAVWSYARSDAFADLLRRIFSEVRVAPLVFTNDALEEVEMNWIFLARR